MSTEPAPSNTIPAQVLPDRRGFFKGLGLGGVALASMLGDRRYLRGADRPSASVPGAHIAPRAKSIIFLFMCGGASQLETFDPKPELKKREGQLAKDIFTAKELSGFNPEKTFDHCRILPPVFPFLFPPYRQQPL